MEELPVHLDLRDQAAIMSHMMLLEATWLNGSNLAQTVYTCRYLLEHQRSMLSLLLSNSKGPQISKLTCTDLLMLHHRLCPTLLVPHFTLSVIDRP